MGLMNTGEKPTTNVHTQKSSNCTGPFSVWCRVRTMRRSFIRSLMSRVFAFLLNEFGRPRYWVSRQRWVKSEMHTLTWPGLSCPRWCIGSWCIFRRQGRRGRRTLSWSQRTFSRTVCKTKKTSWEVHQPQLNRHSVVRSLYLQFSIPSPMTFMFSGPTKLLLGMPSALDSTKCLQTYARARQNSEERRSKCNNGWGQMLPVRLSREVSVSRMIVFLVLLCHWVWWIKKGTY